METFSLGREEDQYRCSLCNLNEKEDIFHFTGRCAVLSVFRVRWFQQASLSDNQVLEFLNGKNWTALVGYVRVAVSYRKGLIEKFNY